MMILAKPSVSPYLAQKLMELREPTVIAEPVQVPMKPALNLLAPEAVFKDPKKASSLPLLLIGLGVVFVVCAGGCLEVLASRRDRPSVHERAVDDDFHALLSE